MNPDILGKLLALSSALFWAVAVILFKRAGASISPFALTFYKTVISTILLIPVLIGLGIPFLPASASAADLWAVVGSGILGITLADSLLFVALNRIGAGLTAIIECLYSPMILTLSWMLLGERITAEKAGGAFLVVTAVILATQRDAKEKHSAHTLWTGILAGVGAMFFVALGVIVMKPVVNRASPLWVTEIRLIGSLLSLLPVFFLPSVRRAWWRSFYKRENWSHAFPATIIGNLLAMTAWVTAFKLTSLSSAAILNQTNAIFIMILASVWLKEPFTWRRLFSTLLAVAGSLLVLLSA